MSGYDFRKGQWAKNTSEKSMFKYLFVVLTQEHAWASPPTQWRSPKLLRQGTICGGLQHWVTISGNILTVARVNSKLNDSTHGGRNNEAAATHS
jgi:hypothetical protein